MFLGGLGELKYHGKRSLVGEASFGAHRLMAQRRKSAFDDVREAAMRCSGSGSPKPGPISHRPHKVYWHDRQYDAIDAQTI
jgi:hypothetical protein